MAPSKSPRISAVINTLNEEANLRFCLQTLTWCDEIVLVDMFSDDATVEVAKAFTDKIFFHERLEFADPARAYAVDQSTGDWVLIMDADEMVPRQLSRALRGVAEADTADVVSISRKNYLLGEWIKHTGWWPDYQVRFFKRGSVDFPGKIHTQPTIADSARTLKLPDSDDFCITHFNFRDTRQLLDRVNRYTTIEAKEMWEHGQRFEWGEAVRQCVGEFRGRYFEAKGTHDGDRGLFLSTIMGFYRFLAWVKLWEMENIPAVDAAYMERRQTILADWASEAVAPQRGGARRLGLLRSLRGLLRRS